MNSATVCTTFGLQLQQWSILKSPFHIRTPVYRLNISINRYLLRLLLANKVAFLDVSGQCFICVMLTKCCVVVFSKVDIIYFWTLVQIACKYLLNVLHAPSMDSESQVKEEKNLQQSKHIFEHFFSFPGTKVWIHYCISVSASAQNFSIIASLLFHLIHDYDCRLLHSNDYRGSYQFSYFGTTLVITWPDDSSTIVSDDLISTQILTIF